MKKKITMITLLGGFALLIAGAMFFSSCEGPAGADGSDGMDGQDGAAGQDGADGQDANENCILCHDSEVVLFAKQEQSASSHHLTGGNYERNSASCALCHTHQGFTTRVETGEPGTEDIVDPAAINCRTCHMIHENYDDTDWTLVTTEAVDTDFGDYTIDIGTSNLCVNCHQFRAVDPMPEIGGADISITSSRWGPHHGPHANNLWGVGGYMVTGSKDYPAEGSSSHASAGCTACHMAPVPYGGRTAGGHTFNMTYEYHGATEENIEACTGCHSTAETFDLAGVQTMVDTLVSQLEVVFIANGYMDGPGELWNASSSAPLVVSADMGGAMLNYKIVTEDRSKGVHNPAYMVALLTNSLEAVSK